MSGYPVVTDVFLNSQGPFRFLVDTGAQTNQIDLPLANRLGLRPAFRTVVATITGDTVVAGGRIPEVKLGPVSASNQEFLYGNLDAVHKISGDIQGVLGEEFLSRFDYLLDFRARQIMFGALQPEGASRIQFGLIDGRPAIKTDKGQLVIDSGTRAAILYSASRESGAAATETRALRFRAGGQSWSTTAILAPRGSFVEDGLVPATLFRSVYVSNSEKFVVLDPLRVR
ncbi:MAG TPA: retropepsin-like aspartic protease [Bryobacteraceae bacterium]|nr:retropepsin-like aspartic protease [Bryobacteraceae bacterium]